MRIVVDHRERPARVPELLAREPDVKLVEAVLSCGDYALGTRVGIERKTAEDFARSLVDGRLFPQMGAMRRRYVRPLLLLEGLAGPRDVAGVAWPALRGALVSVAVAFGVPVVHSTGPEETAALIAGIGRQLHRQFSLGYVRAGYRPKGWRRRALFILQGLPGIGPRRAAALLTELGSVQAVVSADVATLAQVTGVGLRLAGGIRRAVSEPALSDPEPT